MIAEAFRTFLKANTSVTTGGLTCWARVSHCDGDDGKACFCYEPPPEVAESAAIEPNKFIVVLTAEPSGNPWGTRAKRGTEATVTVKVFGPKGFTGAALGDMAYDLWRVFDRAEIAVTGYENWGVQADSPADDKDALRYPAFRFGVRIRLLEV
jgi:hypothetical protein